MKSENVVRHFPPVHYRQRAIEKKYDIYEDDGQIITFSCNAFLLFE